jgi:glycine betaine/choline ABC-type transport system substrate-binding protein
MSSSGKYIDLWNKKRESIKEKLKFSETKQSLQLDASEFAKVGDRQKYSFNLEFLNGSVYNNTDGSAVARDLAKVLERSSEIRDTLKEGHFKINMDKHFCLWIKKLS